MRPEEAVRVYVGSLGCKLNQSEMDDLASRLAASGQWVVSSPAEADVCILNTCAVTHVAAQKSRQALRRLHRLSPGARLIVTGCYAELSPAELRGLPGVERLVGNSDKDNIVGQLVQVPASKPTAPPRTRLHRTRALVKIQDGCDNACTYCIIHLARGPQRSRPAGEILAQVHACLEAGYREIVLTGVHIGAYGRDSSPSAPQPRGEDTGWSSTAAPRPSPDLPHLDLWSLIARILAETDVRRLRLSSIEPWDLPQRALRLWADPRLCRPAAQPPPCSGGTPAARQDTPALPRSPAPLSAPVPSPA
jgi:threonylcarbamoyladenosine tRNA methylthiotransferase MtaB